MKINYFNFEEGIEGTQPVEDTPWREPFIPVAMKKVAPEWYKKPLPQERAAHMTMKHCPAYINMMSNGYVIRTMADVLVRADENGQVVPDNIYSHFEFTMGLLPQTDQDRYFKDLNYHGTWQFLEGFPFPENFLPFSVKFVTPYSWITDKEVDVVIQPCWWDESYEYVRAMHGLVKLSPNTSVDMNINTWVKKPEPMGHVLIPANTPIAQLLFVQVENKVEFVPCPKNQKYKNILKQSKIAVVHTGVSKLSKLPIEWYKRFLIGRNK